MKVMVPISVLKKKKFDAHNIYKKKVTFSDEIGTQNEYDLPPVCSTISGHEYQVAHVENNENLTKRLKREPLRFYIKNNFFIIVKIVKCKKTHIYYEEFKILVFYSDMLC